MHGRRLGELKDRVRRIVSAGLAHTPLTWWATLHTGQRLEVDLSSSVGRSIAYRRRYEPRLERLIVASLKPGECFVDVGANVGYFSLVAARQVGPHGLVVAIEPNPRLASFIADSAAANDCASLVVLPLALAAEPGLQTLQIQRSSGVSFVGPGSSIRGDDQVVRSVTVAVDTLDAVLERFHIPPPSIVKIDVEGLELDVLRGAVALLARRETRFVIEIVSQNLSRYAVDGTEIFEVMRGAGYEVRDLDERPIDVATIPRPFRGDFLFTPAD